MQLVALCCHYLIIFIILFFIELFALYCFDDIIIECLKVIMCFKYDEQEAGRRRLTTGPR